MVDTEDSALRQGQCKQKGSRVEGLVSQGSESDPAMAPLYVVQYRTLWQLDIWRIEV